MGLFTKSRVVAPFGELPLDEQKMLAHVRTPWAGQPGWPGTARTLIPGVSPRYSVTDKPDPYAALDDNLEKRYSGGTFTQRQLLPANEQTMTREGSQRVAAFSNSLPAAQFFQGLFGQVRWSGVFQGFGLAPRALVSPRPLYQMGNPGAFGTKELHRATEYNPFPPMGSIIPKAL